MQLHQQIAVSLGTGLDGDFRGAIRGRNVTALSREGWDAASAELGEALPWHTRRANLLIEGIELRDSAAALLRIGTVVLRITGECQPCQRMDEASEGLRRCLTPGWRAGVECSVVTPGTIRVGDTVELEPGAAQPSPPT
jgi:MOSC domain-containing protein YiiM